ncbi:hypothetical protein F4775DRAFT_551116 [Biscogniauxia sp. FL1348]|nr:hypothetical protein F4775DRAFT_551116 [Biscogniauxia sp. FL1348]
MNYPLRTTALPFSSLVIPEMRDFFFPFLSPLFAYYGYYMYLACIVPRFPPLTPLFLYSLIPFCFLSLSVCLSCTWEKNVCQILKLKRYWLSLTHLRHPSFLPIPRLPSISPKST